MDFCKSIERRRLYKEKVLKEMLSQLDWQYSEKSNISRRLFLDTFESFKFIFRVLFKDWIEMKITLIVLFALVCILTRALGYPQSYTIDRFDRNYGGGFDDSHQVDDYRNSRLRRTYYGGPGDDYHRGYYSSYQPYNRAPVPLRREDTNIDRALKFTPLVRYKSTRTKRKKLFVPNLWG
ncbi:uncharacterized protein LOC129951640 [Eupeodes corollae]|uniref:uncharacterized protein LOC129951640 n=1 Tax=Eupeodes corollae TaxID=290404 RepID=UPI00249170D8|nr:uncharacterized protein LOC129951640 [Eupeodes corollae]